MARLNLICNGMMLFNEVRDYLQIVIPDIPGHVRKFCANPLPAQDVLVDVPVGDYNLSLPGVNKARLADLLDSTGYITLDGNKVAFQEAEARKISAVITVPKPNIIRLFRASEPLPGFDMLGNCKQSVTRVPTVAHDIVVLSYKEILDGTAIGIEPRVGAALATAKLTPFSTVNWMLYSNEINAFPLKLDFANVSDADFEDALAPLRHPTPLNTFLQVKVAMGMGTAPTTLSLSGIGKKDAPADSAIGMTARQQFLFHELPATSGGPIVTIVSGEPGCTGAALVTQ